MEIRTFTGVPREQVDAIFANKQRAFAVPSSEQFLMGDVVRFVSDETDPRARCDTTRAVTHRLEIDDLRSIISLRPLATFEKDNLKTADSGATA